MKHLVLLFGVLLVGCAGGNGAAPNPNRPVGGVDKKVEAPTEQDALGPRPVPAEPAPFTPPVPVEYVRRNGMRVWLLERHSVPMVSIEVVVPGGAARDPALLGGLALATADMLDEGAGRRDALAVARDIDRLGASLSTGAYADYAYVHLTTLKKNLDPAAEIFGDVLGSPRMDPTEWKRVHDLWLNELRTRQTEPDAVAAVVQLRKGYPEGHPYGHPSAGTLASASKVTIEDVKSFYAANYKPELSTVVVVGDVTKSELEGVLDRALPAAWKAPRERVASLGRFGPAKLPPNPLQTKRVWIVDRPEAPQSVISVFRRGVAAGDPKAALLARINSALGGSFTSRLNQDLREEHGWSYGARSRFSFTEQEGHFVAQAAVHTEHTGDALKAMLADIEAFARSGLTGEEVTKSRLLVRSDLVESFETISAATQRLARNAGVGLGPGHEAEASRRAFAATEAELAKLAADHTNLNESMIVVVGPRAKIAPQLAAIGLAKLDAATAEGD